MGDRSIGVDMLGDEADLARALGEAATKLDEVARKVREASGDVNIGVDVDNARGDEKIDETKRKLDEVDGKTARAKVDVDKGGTDGVLAGIAMRLEAIIVLAPVALAALGAVAGIGAVVGGGIAVAIAGFSGVGDAVQAMGQKAAAGGSAVKVSADAVHAATETVAAAQRSYTDALDGVDTAQRGVAAAARDVEAAQRAVERAAQNEQLAERDLARAQADEEAAQRSLTDARRQAADQLKDLQLQTEDMALSQRDAALSVEEARARASQVAADPKATDLQRQRANLAVDEAIQRQKDLGQQASELAAKKADADKKGVEGSDAVTAAQKRIADAQDRVQAATQRVADAQQAQADAGQKVLDAIQKEADAQKALAKAHEQVALAQEKIADAQHKLNEAQHPQASGGSAVDPVAQAMAKLGPAAQEFAKFMRAFLDGPLADLRKAGQEAFLPGIESGLKRLEPMMKTIQPAFAAFSGAVGKALGDLIPIFGRLAGPFLDFATAALEGMKPLEPIMKLFASQLGGVFEQLSKSGVAKYAMEGITTAIGELLPILPSLIDAGVKILAQFGPTLERVFKALADAIIAMLPHWVELAPQVAKLLDALIPLLPDISQLVISAIQLTIALAPLIISIANQAVQIANVLVPAIRTLVDWFNKYLSPAISSLAKLNDNITQGVIFVWQKVIGFFQNFGPNMARVGSTMWAWIQDGFRGAINWVIGAWNRLNFTMPSFSFAGATIGGFSVGVGHITPLATGGIVTRPTLALVGEAGPEAVIPLQRGAGSGGALGGGHTTIVNIWNAVVGNEDAIRRVVTDAVGSTAGRGYGAPA